MVLALVVCGFVVRGQQPDAAAGDGDADSPRGFRNILLGMSLEQTKEELLRDPLFDYRGDPDVSFLPLSEQTLIECGGNAFISRAYFQFSGGTLATITLALERDEVDHYTMFTTLSEKYGPHDELNPQRVVWRLPQVDLALERPLTVKYIDRAAFDAAIEAGAADRVLGDVARERFLEQF
jgi:hypothetical protein